MLRWVLHHYKLGVVLIVSIVGAYAILFLGVPWPGETRRPPREHLRCILDNGNKLAVHAKAEDLMEGLD